jgi:hypothetical protein
MSALPLITISNDGKFQVNQTTLKKIAALGPIAVVSIAGLYRTGKSYLLNRLLGQQSGFKVCSFSSYTSGSQAGGTYDQSVHQGHLRVGQSNPQGGLQCCADGH